MNTSATREGTRERLKGNAIESIMQTHEHVHPNGANWHTLESALIVQTNAWQFNNGNASRTCEAVLVDGAQHFEEVQSAKREKDQKRVDTRRPVRIEERKTQPWYTVA